MNRKLAVTLGAVALALAAGGYLYWRHQLADGAQDGVAEANGRIEIRRFDVATKYPGRILGVDVREGDEVRAGQLVATLDGRDVDARYRAAQAGVTAAADAEGRAESEVRARQAQLTLAEAETGRADRLVGDEAVSRSDVDRAHTEQSLALAGLSGARAAVAQAAAGRSAAQAQLAEVQAARDDLRLVAPVSGRVEYRVVEPGAVVGAGSRVVTLLDPTDVRMIVFLPTAQIGRLAMGAEARLVLDGPDGKVLPAHVSFISADAQFTPRAVETASERDKLMYRVELAVDPKALAENRAYIHGGLTGEAYVRLDPRAPWPEAVQQAQTHGR
jgi:HlyD family secretion protein